MIWAGLRGGFRLAFENLTLLGQHFFRNVLPANEAGAGRRHLHRQIFDKLLELGSLRHEVRFAIDLDEDSDLATVNIRADEAFGGGSACLLFGSGLAPLPKDRDRLI